MPKPYCPAELSIFLGLRFLSNYYPLLRQNAPWNWTAACAAAVHRSLYVLVHFDLLSRALNKAVGAVIAHPGWAEVLGGREGSPGLHPGMLQVACVPGWMTFHIADWSPGPRSPVDHNRLGLQVYNYTIQLKHGRENIIADLHSRGMPNPTRARYHPRPQSRNCSCCTRLNRQPSPCQSYGWQRHRNPVLTQRHSFISEDWPTRVLEKPGPFHRLGSDLASWNNICVVRGLCTVVQSALRELVLAMVHGGHLDIVKIKQRCRGLVWWQGIGRDVETMVRPYLTSAFIAPLAPSTMPRSIKSFFVLKLGLNFSKFLTASAFLNALR